MLPTVLLTTGLAIVFFVAEHYFVLPWLHPGWRYMLLFFLGISFLIHRLVSVSIQQDRARFVPLYVAATVARFVFGLGFVGVYLFRQVDGRRTFVFDFLVLYICYAGFEIWGLTRNLRRDS